MTRTMRIGAAVLVWIGAGCTSRPATTGNGGAGGSTAGRGGAADSVGGAGGVSEGGTSGGGTAGAVGGASGISGGGAAGAASTGGASGGPGGDAGTGAGASGGRGGGATAAGGSGGGAGTGGAAGTALDVTAALDGQKYLMPCSGGPNSFSILVCNNPTPDNRCPHNDNFLISGNVMRDDTVTVGGTPGAIYDVTLRVRGIVEPKHYMNGAMGAPANGTNYGWYVGGEPKTAGDYGKYMLWVSAPVVMPTGTLGGQYYFLNAIDYSEAHFSYPIDYTVTLPVAAGAQIRFLADDSNCLMNRNCDTTSIDGASNIAAAMCNPTTLADLPASAGITQPYPGQFIYLSVVSAVMR